VIPNTCALDAVVFTFTAAKFPTQTELYRLQTDVRHIFKTSFNKSNLTLQFKVLNLFSALSSAGLIDPNQIISDMTIISQ
jgi:hypothetical protein